MSRRRTDDRDRSFSRGRWEVERERFHIDDAEPVRPLEESDSIATTMGLLVDKLGLKHPGWSDQCEAEWDKIVGAGVARHTRPGKLLGTRLIVFVDTPVWLSELSRNGKSTMLKRLQQRFGADRIGAISLQLDPGRP